MHTIKLQAVHFRAVLFYAFQQHLFEVIFRFTQLCGFIITNNNYGTVLNGDETQKEICKSQFTC